MQTTSQTWKTLWASGGAKLEARATIGNTTYTSEITAPVIRRALMQELLSVGNVVSAECVFALRTTNTIATSAEVLVEMRLTDGTTNSEWLPAGTFFIAKRRRNPNGSVLSLELYDALLKANAVWTPSAGSWPRSMASVAAELATLLGLTQDSRNAIEAYTMEKPETGTTIRDVLSAIAAANGGNWIVSPAGRLRLVPLQDAATAAAASDAAVVQGVLNNLAYDTSTTVTGLRYSVDGAPTLLGGDTGAVIDMGENGTHAQSLYDVVVGLSYQGYSLAGAIYDPAAELGDGIAAGASGEIRSLLCSEVITLGPLVQTAPSAPSAGGVIDEYPYIGGAANKALIAAKAYANEVTSDLDTSLDQQSIFNRLTDNGAAQGMYLVNGQLYVNASYINTGYLSASYIQGGTLTLGGANNVNGILEMYDAQGTLKGQWDNSNLSATGSLALNGNSNSTLQFNMGDTGYFKVDQYRVKMLYRPNLNPIYVGFGNIPFGTSRVYYPIYVGNGVSAGASNNRVTITPTSIAMTYGPHDYTETNVLSVTDSQFIYRGNDAIFYGNFHVYDGTKSRVVSTDQYADRLLYCYETPSPLFGDVGEGKIGEDGKCYVWLDPVFAQTITTTQYQVFLQRYGDGDCYVNERKGNYFVVTGTPGMAFGWEIKAKQKDFDQRRLDRNDEPFTVPQATYGVNAAQYITNLRKERESA